MKAPKDIDLNTVEQCYISIYFFRNRLFDMNEIDMIFAVMKQFLSVCNVNLIKSQASMGIKPKIFALLGYNALPAEL